MSEEEFDLSQELVTLFPNGIKFVREDKIKEFIRREIDRRQLEIDVRLEEGSRISLHEVEELREGLAKFKKDAGELGK